MKKNLTKTFLYALSLLFLSLIPLETFAGNSALLQAKSGRIIYTINDNWEFSLDDLEGFEKAAADREEWEKVNIPHTWNDQDVFDDTPGYRRGASWYRKELKLNSNLQNKRIFLYFEGVNQVADLFVNEKYIGQHIGGYTAFSFDITDFVRFDETNLIAVKVDNSFNEDIPPLTGDFNMYGGIYRDVWLIATEDVHLKVTDLASSGVQISTPNLSEESGTVKISGTVVNSSSKARQLEAVTSVVDSTGKEIVSTTSKVEIKSESEANFAQTTKPISNPRLWSPDDPYLYQVKTVIRESGRILDEISNPLGFRWFSVDAQKGFLLNGKPTKLRGTNRHQDHQGFGNAVADEIHIRDMELIKDTGYNFVRLAHYPQDPSILAAADRLGLLIWEEIPIINYITVSAAFNRNSEVMLREMIRQHRNHPSVIMWAI